MRRNLLSWFATSLSALALIVAVAGCGSSAKESAPAAKTVAMAPALHVADAPEALEPVNAVQDKNAPPPLEKVKRKVKYVAEMKFITEDFPKAEAALLDAIDAHNGFLANADVSASSGQPRFGVWAIRVPIERVEEFRKAIAKIGELETSKVKTDDVTAQFYDLENHIKNQKAQEEAMRELLKKQVDKMENMLSVQRELASIRNSIERSEGAMKLLANLADLTTVTVRINERRKYVPENAPKAAEPPTFGARAGATFGESWQGLVSVVQAVAIFVVAITPWLPVIAVVTGLVWYVVRRWRAPVVLTAAPVTRQS